MGIFFFLFWVILNGKLTWEITIFGIVISLAMYWFTCRFLGYRPAYDLFLLKNSLTILQYILTLIKEIVLANLVMARFVFTHRVLPEPAIVSFRPPLKTAMARTILANSITLTPGTITVDMYDGYYQVHCYDKSMAEGIDSSDFVRLLAKMEETL